MITIHDPYAPYDSLKLEVMSYGSSIELRIHHWGEKAVTLTSKQARELIGALRTYVQIAENLTDTPRM